MELEWKLILFANQTNFHVPSKALPCQTLLWAKITWMLRLLSFMNRNVLIHVTFSTKFGWANSTSIGFLLFMNLDDVLFQLTLLHNTYNDQDWIQYFAILKTVTAKETFFQFLRSDL